MTGQKFSSPLLTNNNNKNNNHNNNNNHNHNNNISNVFSSYCSTSILSIEIEISMNHRSSVEKSPAGTIDIIDISMILILKVAWDFELMVLLLLLLIRLSSN